MSSANRDLPAWIISLIVNLSVLFALHNIVHELPWERSTTAITSIFDEQQADREFTFTEVSATDLVGNDGSSFALTPTMQAATQQGEHQQLLQEELDEMVNPTAVEFSQMSSIPLQDQLATVFENRGQTDKVAGGVEGAMDRITFEIAASLKERQTFVLWLFDASGSLRDRRSSIADRFELVYKQLETQGKTEGLYTAIASYGESTNILTPDPVTEVKALVQAVREIEVDESGLENVIAAVQQTVDKWKRFHRNEGRWNKMVFIVTDERGDDIESLEETITLCKRFGVRVYTVGNAAIFGKQEGYVDYRDEADGYMHRNVVVDQGPESAFPHQVKLAFWGGEGVGGRLLRMSAGYGPYGLTRLCAETGGMFFITDENKGFKFDMAVMREYAPDYRPIRELEADVRQNPAKTALVQAAMAVEIDDVPAPQLAFRADDDTILRQQITEAQKPLADFQYHVDRLYKLLEQGMSARDTLTNPRWRAGFDLAMGRVQAMRVRAYGYNVMLANMKSAPQTFQTEGNNLWVLQPSDKIETGPSVRKSAEEATVLLKRVIDEHAGTPWAALAERELSQPLGWEWTEGRIDIEAILAGNQDAPPRLLLEEERRRVDAQRPKPEPVRPPPKL
ncbi:MAG: VWA domain-containing protein [Planctomycetaceae bacterium]|nr:VWA domain-containing protein [Planctomycetaceae bacterium]